MILIMRTLLIHTKVKKKFLKFQRAILSAGEIGNVGGHVSDGYAFARAGVRYISEKTEIVSAPGDHLEHGRRGAGRRRFFHRREDERYLRQRVIDCAYQTFRRPGIVDLWVCSAHEGREGRENILHL